MGGGARILEASATVDGDVHENRAGLHCDYHLVGYQLGCGTAGNKNGADDDVRIRHLFGYRVGRGTQGGHLTIELGIELAEAGERDVENRHLGAHAEGQAGGVFACCSAANDDELTLGGCRELHRGKGRGHRWNS